MELAEILKANGYSYVTTMPDGTVCGILPQLFTTGLFCGLNSVGYERRYCYEHGYDAIAAILVWDGKGDPPGPWIKLKARSGERLGPGATSE